MSGRVWKRRPVQPRLPMYDRGLVLERLSADERYRNLSGLDQHVLKVAVERWMGGHGFFWPKREVWAKEASVCVRTISRATEHFSAVGLITKWEYHRPPGGRRGGLRGSDVCRLDPNIVGEKLLTVPAHRSTRRDTESPPVEPGEGGPACRDREPQPVDGSRGSTRSDSESRRPGAHTLGLGVPTELDLDRNEGNNNNREPRGSQVREPRRRDGGKGHKPESEPPDFAALLEGIALRGKGRDFALACWHNDPDLAEVQVAEWWERRPYSKPGLLVEMMRRGDDPRVHAQDDSEEIPF